MSLDEQQFLNIVANTPLVSIDLVILSERNRVLLGQRVNRPAQGYWFVPGGRIRKNETIREAFRRISLAELGIELPMENARLLGGYDHIYEDNYYGRPGINTHYVVLGYACELSEATPLHPDAQHTDLVWWDVSAALESPEVHENTRRYLK